MKDKLPTVENDYFTVLEGIFKQSLTKRKKVGEPIIQSYRKLHLNEKHK